jgi:hypothetical protein
MACYTIKEGKDLWDYAKETYLKVPHPTKGYMDFKELTNRLSDDIWKATGGALGPNGERIAHPVTGKVGRTIVPEEVAKLISMPKALRRAGKDLLLTARNRRGMLNQAREFTSQTERTPLGRFLTGAYQAPYAAKTVGHGPALHMTHAWAYALQPKMWGTFGDTWLNSVKAMNPSYARKLAESIMLDPRFDEKINSGLAVDPRVTYDDVQNRAQFMGVLGTMTKNSFLGLKQLRSFAWDQIYDKVPEHLRTQEMRDLISNRVNHMAGAPGRTGTQAMSGKAGKVARGFFFAPSLDIARVMRMYDIGHDVGITLRDVTNKLPVMGEQLKKFWGASSPEEIWMARNNMKQWAWIAGTFAAILYTNQQMLKHVWHSDENINPSDPFKPDWMAGKGPNGRVWQFTGGEVPMIRTGIRLVADPKQAPNALGYYFLGKINPALEFMWDIRKKMMGVGNLPEIALTGKSLEDWTVYLASELGPIATEEGIKEFAKQMDDQNGLPGWWNESILRATKDAGLVTIPALLGTHTYQPTPSKEKVGAMFPKTIGQPKTLFKKPRGLPPSH